MFVVVFFCYYCYNIHITLIITNILLLFLQLLVVQVLPPYIFLVIQFDSLATPVRQAPATWSGNLRGLTSGYPGRIGWYPANPCM